MIFSPTDPRFVSSKSKQIGSYNLGKNVGKGCACTSQPNEQDALEDAQLSCDFVVRDGDQLTLHKGEIPDNISDVPCTSFELNNGEIREIAYPQY